MGLHKSTHPDRAVKNSVAEEKVGHPVWAFFASVNTLYIPDSGVFSSLSRGLVYGEG